MLFLKTYGSSDEEEKSEDRSSAHSSFRPSASVTTGRSCEPQSKTLARGYIPKRQKTSPQETQEGCADAGSLGSAKIERKPAISKTTVRHDAKDSNQALLHEFKSILKVPLSLPLVSADARSSKQKRNRPRRSKLPVTSLNAHNQVGRDNSPNCGSCLKGHVAAVTAVRWSKGRGHLLASSSLDETVRIWDIFSEFGNPRTVRELTSHGGGVRDLQWSRDSVKLFSGGHDKRVHCTNVESGSVVVKFAVEHEVNCISTVPWNENLIIVGLADTGCICLDLRAKKVAKRYSFVLGDVQDICFFPDESKRFIRSCTVRRSGEMDQGITVCDFDTGAVLSNQIYMEGYTCGVLAVHPYHNFFVAQSQASYAAMFSLNPPYKLNAYKRYEGIHQVGGYRIQCGFNAAGDLFATGSADGSLAFYDAISTKPLRAARNHSSVCSAVEFHPHYPSVIATGGWDGRSFCYANDINLQNLSSDSEDDFDEEGGT